MSMQDVSGIHTVEDLFARLDEGPPDRIFHFDGRGTRELRLTSDWKSSSDSHTDTWKIAVAASAQLSRGGGIVSNVTLSLQGDSPSDGRILDRVMSLRGSSRVEFRQVCVKGGVPSHSILLCHHRGTHPHACGCGVLRPV